MFFRFLFTNIFLINLLITSAFVSLPEQITFSEPETVYNYGEKASFKIQINNNGQVKDVFLFLKPEGQTTDLIQAKYSSDGKAVCEFDLNQSSWRPFSKIEYWYKVFLISGSETDSQHYFLDYVDNRFNWQSLKSSPFEVHWYQGDISLGQSVLNSAVNGLKTAQALINSQSPVPLRIFVYDSAVNLQSALKIGQLTWVAGHASPDIGVVMVSISTGPEQNIEIERQVPHEIMHILQYQAVGEAYNRLPVWLVEGLASTVEAYPNPDYERALRQAADSGSLISIKELCQRFPEEASRAFLAYAESSSFVKFIQNKYGVSALQNLLLAYGNGVDCETGVSNTLGSTLRQIDNRWQQEALGVNASLLAWQSLSPYLALLAIFILLPAGISLFNRMRDPGKGNLGN